MTTQPTLPSMQKALALGRPVVHEDINPGTAREFFTKVATRSRGWPAPTGVSLVPMIARLDAGRWLADCPLGCKGAELVSPADPYFFCLSCGSGNKFWPVTFPRARASIESEVVKRQNVLDWAWNPGETLINLRAETRRLKG